QPPTDALLASHAFTLFGASYETCQSALAWTLLLLAQHPQAARMLLDEMSSFEDGLPGKEIEEYKWLDAVVKESMRLLPPVPYQMRESMRSTELGGLQVRSRTRIILSSLLTNRLPALYRDADAFQPDRWSAIKPSQYEYLVFSAGPRTCIGMRFGLLF